jgi:hypothetical protein
MLALPAFEHVRGLQGVGAWQPGGADHSLNVPVDETWFSRFLAVRHPRLMAQVAAVEQRSASMSTVSSRAGASAH